MVVIGRCLSLSPLLQTTVQFRCSCFHLNFSVVNPKCPHNLDSDLNSVGVKNHADAQHGAKMWGTAETVYRRQLPRIFCVTQRPHWDRNGPSNRVASLRQRGGHDVIIQGWVGRRKGGVRKEAGVSHREGLQTV